MNDFGPLVAGIAVVVLLPLLLWAEAVWRPPRWFRNLTDGLALLWFVPVASLSLPDLLCDGSVLKGLTSCKGPFGSAFYERLLVTGPLLPVAAVLYAGAVVARCLQSRRL